LERTLHIRHTFGARYSRFLDEFAADVVPLLRTRFP